MNHLDDDIHLVDLVVDLLFLDVEVVFQADEVEDDEVEEVGKKIRLF